MSVTLGPGFVFVCHQRANGTADAELYVKTPRALAFGWAPIMDAALEAGLPTTMINNISAAREVAHAKPGPWMFVVDHQGQFVEAWRTSTTWRTLRRRLATRAAERRA